MDTKQELVRHYRWLRQYGLNDSHSGNASVRDGNTLWFTPTGCCADTLEPEQLIKGDVTGAAEGASLDAPLHIAVYRHNDEAGCVLHCHGVYTLALTMGGEDFEPIDFEGQYYFGQVPVLNIEYGDYLDESPAQVGRTLSRHKVCVVRGHGIYAQAPTINLAYKWCCTLEHTAKVAYLSRHAKPGL
jgi:L-fuculose-phosphate aldolase